MVSLGVLKIFSKNSSTVKTFLPQSTDHESAILHQQKTHNLRLSKRSLMLAYGDALRIPHVPLAVNTAVPFHIFRPESH